MERAWGRMWYRDSATPHGYLSFSSTGEVTRHCFHCSGLSIAPRSTAYPSPSPPHTENTVDGSLSMEEGSTYIIKSFQILYKADFSYRSGGLKSRSSKVLNLVRLLRTLLYRLVRPQGYVFIILCCCDQMLHRHNWKGEITCFDSRFKGLICDNLALCSLTGIVVASVHSTEKLQYMADRRKSRARSEVSGRIFKGAPPVTIFL